MAAPHTPRPRIGLTRSLESLTLAEDIGENDEVVGGGS